MQEFAQSEHTTKYQNRESLGKGGTPLTLERVEDYLSSLAAKGRVQSTIDGYRRSMRRLYHTLPEGDKTIRLGTLHHWREQLLEGVHSMLKVYMKFGTDPKAYFVISISTRSLYQ